MSRNVFWLVPSLLIITSCSKNIDSVESAHKKVVGTWVADFGDQWIKIIFNTDGTYIKYNPNKIANDWGTPVQQGTWKIITDKNETTGLRYYAVTFDDYSTPYIIRGNQISWGYSREFYLKKGDIYPFNK